MGIYAMRSDSQLILETRTNLKEGNVQPGWLAKKKYLFPEDERILKLAYKDDGQKSTDPESFGYQVLDRHFNRYRNTMLFVRSARSVIGEETSRFVESVLDCFEIARSTSLLLGSASRDDNLLNAIALCYDGTITDDNVARARDYIQERCAARPISDPYLFSSTATDTGLTSDVPTHSGP
jgi:hypothetical protein